MFYSPKFGILATIKSEGWFCNNRQRSVLLQQSAFWQQLLTIGIVATIG